MLKKKTSLGIKLGSRGFDTYVHTSCMESFWFPSSSVVQKAAMLFCCEAPEMFYGLQNFSDNNIYFVGWSCPLISDIAVCK